MAFNDIRLLDAANAVTAGELTFLAEANTTVMLVGEPIKVKTAGSKYAIPLADAEPVIGTTTAVVGIVSGKSTQTASADGVVQALIPASGIVYAAKAKSATAADTEAEILALIGKRVLLDLTSSVYTVDTAASDNANNGILIVGGDAAKSEIFFMIRSSATILN